MSIPEMVLIALVAALHAWFMLLEMVFWTRPLGLKTFGMTPDQAEATKVLAANQGLYNGFLAAGLGYALLTEIRELAGFLLACVVVAGVYGAATVGRRILVVQALPAMLALLAMLL